MINNHKPDFEISEASISGTHQRADIFDRKVRSRRHMARITAQISILVVIALVAGYSVARAPLQAFISAQQGTPTPTRPPTPLPQVIIQTDVTYGTLTVNGKAVPLTSNYSNTPLTLTKQRSVITISAPPFPPITCTIDSTNLNQSGSGERCNLNGSANNIPIVNMNLTLNDLPQLPHQQFATYLAQKLTQLNAVQITVPAREHYAVGIDAHGLSIVAVTSSPLRAQTLVTLQPPSSQLYGAGCSGAICPGYTRNGIDTTSPQFLDMQLQVNIGWQFYDGSGRQTATYQMTGNAPNGVPQSAIDIALTYNAATGWHDLDRTAIDGPFLRPSSSSQLANNLCQLDASLMDNLLGQSSRGNNYSYFSESATLSGCVLASVVTNKSQSSPDPNADLMKDTNNAWFLVHFGALLAVNAKAHALLPQLPQANSQEVADVQRAMQQQTGG